MASGILASTWYKNGSGQNLRVLVFFRFVEPQGTPGAEGGGQAPPGGGTGLDQHGDIEDFKLIKTITAYNSKKVAEALQHSGFAFAHVIDRKDNDAWDLEYKIVATHTDGGFSLPVTVVVEGYWINNNDKKINQWKM